MSAVTMPVARDHLVADGVERDAETAAVRAVRVGAGDGLGGVDHHGA
ncbi:hypothetical protein AB0D12_40340 [Streptomyces sp. NPDC048479]